MKPDLEEKLNQLVEQFSIQNYLRAIKIAEELMSSSESEYRILGVFYKSISLSHIQKENDAIELLNNSIQTFEAQTTLYQARFEILTKIGRFLEAKEDALKLISLEESNPENYFKLIEVLEQLMDYEQIINICEQLLPEYSQDFDLLEAKISALMGLKQFKNAITELKKLEELSDETSDRIWVYNNWGYCCIKQEDFQQAESILSQAISLNPNAPFVLNNLGFALFKLGKTNEGIDRINHSIKVDSSNSYAYKNRAELYIKLGKLRKAKTDLEYALKLGYRIDYDGEVDELLENIR